MKTLLRSLAPLAAALLLLARPASAQESPTQAAERYFRSMQAGDWPAAAGMMHPSALAQFQRLFGELARHPGARPMLESVFQVRPAEVDSLAPAALFARVTGRLMSLDPATAQAMRAARYEVTGERMAGDTAQVEYRITVSPAGQEPVSVASQANLLKDGAAWKLLLQRDTEAMFQSLKTMLDAQPSPAPAPGTRP